MKRRANNENVKSESTKAPAIREGRRQPEVTQLDLAPRAEREASGTGTSNFQSPAPNTPPASVEEFIEKPEVMKRLGLSLRKLNDLMQRQRLPHYKLGRAVRFRWSEIERHLADSCRVGGEKGPASSADQAGSPRSR